MTRLVACIVVLVLTTIVWQPALASAGGVKVLFDLAAPSGGPFPSDRFTEPDATQNTGLRVNLPKPDCVVQVSDCEDIDLLNDLDGFNVQPRLSIPFSGPIDVNSVTSGTVFLVSLGSRLPGGPAAGKVIGINRRVWDVATQTLHVESDELLDQHTRYILIVTRGVRDAAGDPIDHAHLFKDFLRALNFGHTRDRGLIRYGAALLSGLVRVVAARIVDPRNIAAASVFTTQSVTAVLERVRDQIGASPVEPADFLLGPGGRRTVFPLADVTGLFFNRQTLTEVSLASRLQLLSLIPGAVGRMAFGRYSSPRYIDVAAGPFIEPFGTRSGTPTVLGTSEIYFNLFLPSGTPPPAGWPVAIYGPGAGETKNDNLFNIAATFASHGIATMAINHVGRGFGPLSTLRVRLASGEEVSFSAGGRSADENGDGIISNPEGSDARAPRASLSNGPAQIQWVADLVRLVRVVEAGVDVDGDGGRDIDPDRIYYVGFSAGATVGISLAAIEPRIRALVSSSPGGLTSSEQPRLSPLNRPAVGRDLAARVPSLINPAGTPLLTSMGGIPVAAPFFNENLPLRNQPPVVNTIAGAMEIQQVLDHRQWLAMLRDPFALAPYLRKSPLDGVPAKLVIILLPRGDQNISNPTVSATIRSGELEDRATFFRNDLAFAADPTILKNPHSILVRTDQLPNRAIARAAQEQAAVFFATDGAETIDPDGAGLLFEVPIEGSLPEDFGYIP